MERCCPPTHIFLVGGCDGKRRERSYHTEFVKQAPADTVILTLACGKYRFNDLELGTIGDLPLNFRLPFHPTWLHSW